MSASSKRDVRRFWALDVHINNGCFGDRIEHRVFETKQEITNEWGDDVTGIYPVLVLDWREEARERLVEKIDTAICRCGDWSYSNKPTPDVIARAVLAAL